MVFRFCVFFLCLTIVTSSKQWRSGYRFFNDIDGWLKLNPIPATWDVARMRCQSEGAELASPVDNEMLEAMVMILNKNNNHCGVFTGYHDTYTEGYFHSISGVPISSSPAKWHGRRDKCSDQHGDAFILRPDGTLDTAKKTDAYPFFCYKKYENVASSYNGECGTTDRAYGFSKATGSCYKFHNEGRTWHEAARICSEEGGQLAIINSKEEAQVLRDLFKKYPQSVMDSRFKESALVGFLDWGTNGGWLTIHGQTLNAAGYDSWSPGQPDHSPHPDGTPVKGTTFCGAIFRSALLDDVWCDVKFAFICEKTPAMIDDGAQPNNQDRNECQCQQR